jgi:tetratricopeptide (TPR) repeat protein
LRGSVDVEQAEFSRYRMLSRLGHGGMGEVFLAEDVTLNRKVALKFLQADGADSSKRILTEARAAAHLDHPFICKVYEVGDHDGRPFLAMEFVDGLTLSDRLLRGPVAVSLALRIAREIADALHFAHSRGIVHRDLKPGNIMLSADDHVKVMDFGIAKRLAGTAEADAATAVPAGTATVSGSVSGTYAYMSPEQLRGDAIDPRSDVFAFGVLLFELLTGRNPFVRTSTMATASAILTEPVAPVEAARPEVPPLLGHVVARCLEKDRDRRYQSLGDVRLELEAVESGTAGGMPIGGMPITKPLATASTRRRWLAWTAAAAIVGAAALLPWFGPFASRSPAPPLAFAQRDWILVADFNNLTGDSVFDRSLRLALEVAIAESQYVNVLSQNRIADALQRMRRGPTDPLDETLATEVAMREGARAVLACDIAQVGNTYSLTARLLDPKTRSAVLADSVEANGKEQVLAALGQLATRVRTDLGESLRTITEQGRALPHVTTSSLAALKLYADSLTTAEGNDGQSNELLRQALTLDPEFALAHAELGRRHYLRSDRANRELGEKYFERALQLTDRLTLRERLWIRAISEDSRGNRQRAVDAYQAYLAQYPDDTRALFRMSWTQMATLGQTAEAVEGFTRLLAIDPRHSSAQVNLATALSARRDYAAAVAAYERAFELDPRLQLGMYINHEYGFTLAQVGRLDAAARMFTRMKTEAEPADQTRGFRSMALLQMLRGKYADAIQELQRAITLDQTYNQGLSEFRDRLYLITALEATGRAGDARGEWRAVDRLVSRLSLSPGWVWRLVRSAARGGRISEARGYLRVMERYAGSATADSGISRNIADDRAHIAVAEAELALAEGRAARAIERSEPAHLYLKDAETLATVADSYAVAGRIADAIARYEELLTKASFGWEAQQVWLDAHLALGKLYEQQKRVQDAARVYDALLARWQDADADLRLLREIRGRRASLRSAS